MAQRFTQRPDIDYIKHIYNVGAAITFIYLVNMTVHEKHVIHLMDVIIAYLYDSLPEKYKYSKVTCSIKHLKYLYGLNQSVFMWFNRLSKYQLKKGYKNYLICPCVFIKKPGSKFVSICWWLEYHWNS